MRQRGLWRTALLFGTTALFIVHPSGARAEEAAVGQARLSFLHGEVLLQNRELSEWTPATLNMPLGPADRLWIGAGATAEIQFPDGSLAHLGEQTNLDIADVSSTPQSSHAQVVLVQGTAIVTTRGSAGGRSTFQVDTATVSTRAYTPAVFRVDAMGEETTQVAVRQGEVRVEMNGGITDLPAGQTIRIAGNFISTYEALSLDDFDQWSKSRTETLARAESSRYLPPPLASYGYELDTHGRWESDREYGHVWVPRVAVGWAPFFYGRWVWIRGDYVWISYEPWGWVPYHYGRWRHSPRRGWHWIPPHRTVIYWTPGAVAWVYGPTYVAWVPLAPGEVYYAHRYYGPGTVVVKNVISINVTNVFVNARVKGGTVVVHKETFLTGRTTAAPVIRENPFLSRRVTVGPPALQPALKPVRESRIPDPEKAKTVKERTVPPTVDSGPPAWARTPRPVASPQASAFTPEKSPAVVKPSQHPSTPPPPVIQHRDWPRSVPTTPKAPERLTTPPGTTTAPAERIEKRPERTRRPEVTAPREKQPEPARGKGKREEEQGGKPKKEEEKKSKR